MKQRQMLLSLTCLFFACGTLAGCSNSKQALATNNTFLVGETEPTAQVGTDGDTYLNNKTYDLYQKENGTWVKVGNISGSKGEAGKDGNPGKDGTPGKDGNDGSDGRPGENGLSAYDLYRKYHPVYEGTEEEWVNALADGSLAASYKTSYNIIFTIATIPPVLSALDSIRNGNDTYAFIERGKTYSGISQLSNWHNIGFNTNSNNSSGFVVKNYEDTLKVIKELNVFGNEHFNIYLQDGNGLYGAYFAANAQLSQKQYDVVMIEDGTGAYNAFEDTVIGNKKCTNAKDDIFDSYKQNVDRVSSEVNQILSSKTSSVRMYYDIPKAFYLSALDNYHYWLQDSSQIENALNKTVGDDATYTKLFEVMGINKGRGEEVKGYEANLKFESISSGVKTLSAFQKENYLRLMYGNYYEDTFKALTRTTFPDETTASNHKLVYIGTRLMGFPAFASNAQYGIGGVSSASEVPSSYSLLDAKYKTDFLFENESDYELFINTVENNSNYDKTPTSAQKDKVKVASFNQYINYMFALKYAQKMYGEDYDLIIKGHPSEVMGAHQNWSRHYTVNDGDSTFVYDKLIDQLMLNFHSSDTSGKYIGSVPYGTAAENLAYLGADISICGLPSSTYTGYDTSVPVLFVMSETNGDISSDGNLASRYQAGSLAYTDLEGNADMTSFVNTGYVYKSLAAYYEKEGKTELAAKYQELFRNWLIATYEEVTEANVSLYSINEQGSLISLE